MCTNRDKLNTRVGIKPGDGIRSLDSSSIFRVANFELFVKPNKYVMGAGICAVTLCIGYFVYINHQIRSNPSTYVALNEDNTQVIRDKKSKWS
ncbi:small integral membrane protein 8-like [Oppia nitens]|uniref:small integral membrane protein 8-like n=1 Tax=Oppia nitens TaxID=1686743 RepID=UPI0023D99E62|nr:small integral membrane protein 8-like [Oppia nitens]